MLGEKENKISYDFLYFLLYWALNASWIKPWGAQNHQTCSLLILPSHMTVTERKFSTPLALGEQNRSPKCNMWYPLPCFAWLSIWVKGSRAAAPKGTKSCRTQGDFHSSYLKKWMRCYRGLTEGIQEPKLRSKKADIGRRAESGRQSSVIWIRGPLPIFLFPCNELAGRITLGIPTIRYIIHKKTILSRGNGARQV